jgi:hypothetical protein
MTNKITFYLKKLWWSFHPRFDGKKIKTLNDFYISIPTIRPKLTLPNIAGWLRPEEKKVLYALSLWLPGPFLEIGAWVGLSTSIIACGIRDSKENKQFITAELNPSIHNFKPVLDGIGFFNPVDSTTPSGVCSLELFERDIKPFVSQPGGIIGMLNKNLTDLQLQDYVQIVEGDFRRVPKLNYRFIFSDTMHDTHEILNNAPSIRELVSSGTILACHDTTSENEKTLRQCIDFNKTFIIDSLFVGEVA